MRHLIDAEVRDAGPAGIALEHIPQRLLNGFRELRLIPRTPTKSEQDKWLQVFPYEAATEFRRSTGRRVSLENLGLVAVVYEFLDDMVADARFGAAAMEAWHDREDRCQDRNRRHPEPRRHLPGKSDSEGSPATPAGC